MSNTNPNEPTSEHDALDASEASIQGRIHYAVGRLPEVRLWRQNAGILRVTSQSECRFCKAPIQTRVVRGVPDGAADLSGIVSDGRRLEIEVKSATGKQRDNQKRWEIMIRERGGIYFVARSPEEALDQLAKRGIIQ